MKSKKTLIIMAAIIISAGTATGYILSDIFNTVSSEKKPVIEIADKAKAVESDTHIIYEREYKKCGHTVVSSFNKADELLGKDLGHIRRIYGADDGYRISWQDQSLIIHQVINGYCPADKDRYRLKEYQGMVTVYRGVEEEEVLERVTEIRMDLLPVSVQEDIKGGKFEFKDRATLNDVLENFDEYLQ